MSVGSDLRQMRETKSITLEQVAQKTKIALKYLEALESDQYDIFPSHTYAKGFLRAYAKVVGADPLLITRQFEEEVEPRSVAIQPAIETAGPRGHALFEKRKMPDGAPQPTSQDFLITFDEEPGTVEEETVPLKSEPFLRRDKDLTPPGAWKMPAARLGAVLIVLAVLYYGWSFLRSHPIRFAPPKPQTKEAMAPLAATATPQAAAVSKPVKTAKAPEPTPTVEEKPVKPAKKEPVEEEKPKPAVRQPKAAAKAPEVPEAVEVDDKYHHVILKGREESWVLVVMDGEKTWEFVLDKGETKSFKAKKRFTVKVGNAAGVDLWYDGEMQGVLGGTGQVVEIRLPKAKSE